MFRKNHFRESFGLCKRICAMLFLVILLLTNFSLPVMASSNQIAIVNFKASWTNNTLNLSWSSAGANPSQYKVQFAGINSYGSVTIPLNNVTLADDNASKGYPSLTVLDEVTMTVVGTGVSVTARVGGPGVSSAPIVTVSNLQAKVTQNGIVDLSWSYGGVEASQFQVQFNSYYDGTEGVLLPLGQGDTVPLSVGHAEAYYTNSSTEPFSVKMTVLQTNITAIAQVASNAQTVGKTFSWNGFGAQWDSSYVELGWSANNVPAGNQATIIRYNPDGSKATFTVDASTNAYADNTALPSSSYTYVITDPNANPYTMTTTLTTGTEGQQGGGSTKPGQKNSDLWDVFTPDRWAVAMTWYYTLAGLSGVFIFLVMVRSGYRYINSATNPGIRADFFADIQRCIMAVGMMIFAPLFVKVIIGIDVGFVHLFANMVNAISAGGKIVSPTGMKQASIFENIIAAPFNTLNDLVRWIFGLPSVDQLVFNGYHLSGMHGAFSGGVFGGAFNTGNAFADAILNMMMIGFTIYYAALYTIRRWVIIATLASTPIIVWVWVLTEERQVLEIWAAEIVSTVFMQLFQALSMGIFFSVLDANGSSIRVLTGIGIAGLATGLKAVGVWIASFGGVMCLFALVLLGYKLMVSGNSKTRADIKQGMGRAITGMGILGLSLEFAGFLVFVLNSPAGQLIQMVKTAIGG